MLHQLSKIAVLAMFPKNKFCQAMDELISKKNLKYLFKIKYTKTPSLISTIENNFIACKYRQQNIPDLDYLEKTKQGQTRKPPGNSKNVR